MSTLKERLSQKEILPIPGVFDALTASLAEQAGFEAVFLSGSAVAYSQLARPDVGLVTMTEMAQVLDHVRDRVGLHIFVDADSGHGNALNVGRTVRVFERAGASGIQIEDQVNTKSMEQVGQHPLISTEAMTAKIKAALDARQSSNTLISARTDAVASEGVGPAFDRASAYADAGADIIFVVGLNDDADRVRLCEAFKGRVPLLHNQMTVGTDDESVLDDIQTLGFSIVLFPGVVIGASANATWQALNRLAGKPNESAPRSINDLIETDKFLRSK